MALRALVIALFLAAGAVGFAFGVSTWDMSDSRGWMG
jgi:hypothetical protein